VDVGVIGEKALIPKGKASKTFTLAGPSIFVRITQEVKRWQEKE
jgi:hypothetical protein